MLWCRGTLARLHDIVIRGCFFLACAGDHWQQVLGDAVVRQVDTLDNGEKKKKKRRLRRFTDVSCTSVTRQRETCREQRRCNGHWSEGCETALFDHTVEKDGLEPWRWKFKDVTDCRKSFLWGIREIFSPCFSWNKVEYNFMPAR